MTLSSTPTVTWAPNSGPQMALVMCPVFEVFFGGARGGGKGLLHGTKALTPFGWSAIESLKPGHCVCSPDGSVSKVIGVYPQGRVPIWKMTFHDGTVARCDGSHIWRGWWSNKQTKRSGVKATHEQLWTMQQILAKFGKTKQRFLIPALTHVSFNVNNRHDVRLLDPYLLGLLLGDGCMTDIKDSQVSFCTADQEINDWLMANEQEIPTQSKKRNLWAYRFKQKGFVREQLGRLKLLGTYSNTKFIPRSYMYSNEQTRWELLRGLMDTDGWCDQDGAAYYCTTSPKLRDDVAHLARSLGAIVTMRTKQPQCQTGTECAEAYTLWIKHYNVKLFNLTRKQALYKPSQSLYKALVSIEPDSEGESTCIKVSNPDGLFIVDDFIVTHNTAGMLGDWLNHSSQYAEAANGLMVRRSLAELQDTIRESKAMYGQIGASYNETSKRWTMPNGATLTFAFLENDDDAMRYMGWAATRLYAEEVGNFPSPDPLMKLMAILRSTKKVPVGFRATGNPGGPGHQWVKARYIDPAPNGYKIIKDDSGLERVFIPSKVQDNKALLEADPTYISRLKASGSAELVRAWLEGDWTVITGAYFPEFTMAKHVIPVRELPDYWTRIRAMDWGSAAPFAIGWFAVSDGTLPEFPKDAMVMYREWYGWNGTPNKGCKMDARDVGYRIREIEENANEDMNDAVLDPAAFSSDGGPSIAERLDCDFRRADNKRIARLGVSGGWDAVRERLRGNDLSEGRPLLYFMDNCVHTIRTLPALQHDMHKPEDVDTTGEDHCGDLVRYGVLSRPLTFTKKKPENRRFETQLTINEIIARHRRKRLGNE